MRILHTSDWHLSRQFFQLPLDEDHDTILAQIDAAILSHSPDVLIIAGDISDRAGPPQTALARLRDFRVRATTNPRLAVVIIAAIMTRRPRSGCSGPSRQSRRRSFVDRWTSTISR